MKDASATQAAMELASQLWQEAARRAAQGEIDEPVEIALLAEAIGACRDRRCDLLVGHRGPHQRRHGTGHELVEDEWEEGQRAP